MFQSASSKTPGSWARAVKAAVPALTLVVGLATASISQAATSIYLGAERYDSTNVASLSGIPGSPANGGSVILAPQIYTANFGTSVGNPTFDLLVFCVDVYHWSGTNLAYNYDYAQPLSTNSRNGFTGDLLTMSQVEQVGRLVNYGYALYGSGQTYEINKLAAVQGAIWKVVNPNLTIDATNNFVDGGGTTIDTLITSLSGANYQFTINADVGPVSDKIRFLKQSTTSADPFIDQGYGRARSHQAFAIAVPEPATWVMMIGGFAVAGGMLRRSRQRTGSSVA